MFLFHAFNCERIFFTVGDVYQTFCFRGSSPEQHIISVGATNDITITHTYTIFNNGPSPLPETTMRLHIPAKTKEGIEIINTDSIEVSLIFSSTGVTSRAIVITPCPSVRPSVRHVKK